MIHRLLIANRGEIAVRIIRACRELGIESVAVYSETDSRSPHVLAADRAVAIGPASAAESYLSIAKLIDAARRTSADALHPGYGFLAENAGFAAACEDAGLIFVGPPARVIERLGSKIEARRLAEAAGVPVAPGETPRDQSAASVADAARRVGLPVLLKPSAGGGGKGMRIVRQDEELAGAIAAARREAVAAFDDGTLYVERLIERPRHIEVQVFGDRHGHLVHLFERECSIQRRHQKMVEESPSPAVDSSLRARMGAAAVAVARAAGYQNAGTIEFLVEGSGSETRFYFLEVNTRLQVEHPVTEAVTGVDLVHAQLAVAAGAPLPWSQDSLTQRGHAIEARVYAEDPARDFLPQAGRLLLYREPAIPGVRIDSGVAEGVDVPVHYDPLLAKLIAHAETREAAIRRAIAALRAYPILGIRTNVSLLIRILDHPCFRAATIDTGFLDGDGADLLASSPAPVPPAALAAAIAHDRAWSQARSERAEADADPWTSLKGWRQ